ncbi:histidine phosphatase superfamily [Apodospora peruviana]|uniref:Histidine phosphatase superfamily n=1 Tax=Apodospora peruviana TaxID=516989 RepID=A0AAE0M100_9PEZI|nr:histidine phosphatase superfamily [Apodospora peruviana]
MASIFAAVALLALAGTGSAQSSSEHIWASVGWILHGERTPYFGTDPPALTPLGAQQLYDQGQMFRSRYLEEGPVVVNGEVLDLERAPIVDIQPNAIDNTQLEVVSNTDSWIFNSALAFMQGLYPPISQAFNNNTGGMDGAMLTDGTLVNYPLDGYQYPNIKTSSLLDPDSIWVQGHVGCTKYTESLISFRNDSSVAENYTNTLDFYHSMWDLVFKDSIPLSMASFYNAYTLYDYAAYHYNHNNDSAVNITEVQLEGLALLAAMELRYRNANLSASGDTQGDMIRAVAGQTMAAKVLSSFEDNIRSLGAQNKLTLAFSSIEPFIAFFTLSQLIKGPAGATFVDLPNPGAAMVFELFSIGGNSSVYPSIDDLWVRFLYRNGTDPDAPLVGYPLFGNGNAYSSIQFSEFITGMQTLGISGVAEWCRVCDSVTLFCLGLDSNSVGDSGPSGGSAGGNSATGISPAVAGVIGAVVTIAVLGLATLALLLLGCLSFHRKESDLNQPRNSSLGGFRGAEKMASDTDLAYAKGGSRHERTGSWELRDGATTAVGDSKGGATAPRVEEEPVSPLSPVGATVHGRSLRNGVDDDAISEMGQQPVKPREF